MIVVARGGLVVDSLIPRSTVFACCGFALSLRPLTLALVLFVRLIFACCCPGLSFSPLTLALVTFVRLTALLSTSTTLG